MGTTPTNSLEPEYLTALHTLLTASISEASLKKLGQAAARKNGSTQQRNAVNTFMAQCGYTWSHVLTPEQKNTFLVLGQNMVGVNGRKKPMDAYTCFFAIASAANLTGGPIPHEAPGTTPVPPAPLPEIDMTASLVAGGGLNVRLVSDAFYQSASVQCQCAPFALTGKDFFSAKSFKTVTVLSELVSGPTGTAIGPEIAEAYGIPAVGMKIAVKLRAVSDTGFKGPVYVYTAIVGASAAEDTPAVDTDGDTTLHVG